jgi:hypothetical protein
MAFDDYLLFSAEKPKLNWVRFKQIDVKPSP